jgi:hypothetical protein
LGFGMGLGLGAAATGAGVEGPALELADAGGPPRRARRFKRIWIIYIKSQHSSVEFDLTYPLHIILGVSERLRHAVNEAGVVESRTRRLAGAFSRNIS